MLQWHHKAVDPPGDAAQRPVVLLPPRPDHPREARAAPTDPRDRPLLDLTWDYPTHGPLAEPGAEAVLRRSTAPAPTAPAVGLHRAQGRRLHRAAAAGSTAACYADGVNQAGPAQARRRAELGGAGVGLGVARQPAHPLQPRLRRPGRQAVERAQGLRLVGRRSRASGPGTTCPTSRPTSRPDYRPPDGRAGARTRSPAPTRSSCRPTARAGSTPRRGWPTGRCRRTTSRTSRRCATRSTASRRTRRGRCSRTRTTATTPPARRRATRRFPYVLTTYRLTEHHTAGGMSRWLPYLVGAAAGVVLRGVARSSPPSAGWTTAAGRRSSRPRRAIEARVLVTERMRPLRVRDGRSTRSACPTTGGRNGLATGDAANELLPIVLDPNVHIQEAKAADLRHPARPPAARAARCSSWSRSTAPGRHHRRTGTDDGRAPQDGMTFARQRLSAPLADPAAEAGHADHRRAWGSSPTPRSASAARPARWPARSGTRSPSDGLDLHRACPTTTPAAWARHLAARGVHRAARAPGAVDLGMPSVPPGGARGRPARSRWLMASDVCKHCTHAACLDVCPTGALFRTEFGTVVVQEDICNGCGYCVPACPYGVIDRREDDGRAWKCTLCYDRLGGGLEPACAKACPTDSIQFGDAGRAARRAPTRGSRQLHDAGVDEARLYGARPGRRGRRRRRVLPAARRARGLRAAARPGRDHPRPAGDVEARGGGGRGVVAVVARRSWEAAMSRRERRWCRRTVEPLPTSAPTTASRSSSADVEGARRSRLPLYRRHRRRLVGARASSRRNRADRLARVARLGAAGRRAGRCRRC